jgi:c-di-GMP-binding flagellar brake protein YcgR
MTTGPNNLKSFYHYYGSKEGNDAAILIDSKAVVEKKEYVATGVLTYALGDIAEIEIPQYSVFNLGDKLKVTVYTRNGIFVFESTVVAKDTGSLIIINPPENRRKFTEKREHARVDVKHKGFLHELNDVMKKRKQTFSDPVDFTVNNISMSGVGFTLSYDLGLTTKSHLQVELDLGFRLPLLTEVIRKEKNSEGNYYGVKYIDLPKDNANALRGFILRNQVESYFIQKKENMHKRAIQDKKSAVNE